MRTVLVAVCSNQPALLTPPPVSLILMGWGKRVIEACETHGFDDLVFHWESHDATVDGLRNRVARKALDEQHEYVLFIDADMVMPAAFLTRMLAHADPFTITSGLYILGNEPFTPIALVNEQWDATAKQFIWQNLDVRETSRALMSVDIVGMGCTLIPTAAFRAVPYPWFYYPKGGSEDATVSEDVPFCQAARKAGYHLRVDPTLWCGHYKGTMIEPRMWFAYRDAVAAQLAKDATPSGTYPLKDLVDA